MKLFLFLLTFFFQTVTFAMSPYVQAKFGAFSFTDGTQNDIYCDWDVAYGAEFGVNINRCFAFAFNYGYCRKNGRAIISDSNDHEYFVGDKIVYKTHKTNITYQNLDLVAKAFWPLYYCVKPYVGVGPRFVFIDIDNDSPYVTESISQTGFGGMVTAGIRFSWCRFYLDPFFEYGFCKMNFTGSKSSYQYDANYNNLLFGVGIGFCF